MKSLLMKKNELKKRILTKRNPFTLVELLVVVAIIAVIGAGIAVTYQNLDDSAKTAMEMSDISALKKVTKHWSAINDYKLLDGMDSLIDTDGNLFTPSTFGDFSMATQTFPENPSSASGIGLNGPLGYATLEAATAPDVVLDNLQVAGMNFTYAHLVTATHANDSTYSKGMGGSVDTSDTKSTLVIGGSEAKVDADEVVADAPNGNAHDYDGIDNIEGNGDDVDYTFTTVANGTVFGPYATLAEWTAVQVTQQAIADANQTDTLAFIFPGGGPQMMGNPAPMNLVSGIIANAGLINSQVANPNDYVQATNTHTAGASYYLVAMGYGKFASLYTGKGVRADSPVTGKRQSPKDADYSRYVAVVKVPIEEYNTMTGSSEAPVVVDVLSPQGYSVAHLQDKFIDDKEKVQD